MLNKLIEYQNVDAQLRAIEQELASNEDRKKGLSAKKFLDTVNDSLAELDGKAADLDSAYTKYTEVFNKLLETQGEIAASSGEYTGEDEISFITKKAQELMSELKTLEKQLVRLQEEIMALTEQYNSLKKKTFAAQKQFKECGQKYNAFKETKAEGQKEIQAALAEMEKDIDPALMEIYKKKRKDKIFPILYEYAGKGFCPQCMTELSRLALSNISAKSYVECDNCGRVLYVNK